MADSNAIGPRNAKRTSLMNVLSTFTGDAQNVGHARRSPTNMKNTMSVWAPQLKDRRSPSAISFFACR